MARNHWVASSNVESSEEFWAGASGKGTGPRHVANVRTPLLMLQGEADVRCPPADNEQFFIALRHLGRDVEYVLYPESFHTYSSNGRPDRRVDRMRRVLDWFERHLG